MSYQQPRQLELIQKVDIIDLEKEPDTKHDLGVKFGYPNGLILYQADVSRIKTETRMLNDAIMEVAPQLFVIKEKGVKLTQFSPRDKSIF